MEEKNTKPIVNNKKGPSPAATRKPEKALLSYLHDLVFLITGIILVFTLMFRVVIVSGPSMYSTLIDGDVLLLLNGALVGDPKAGDVIVASKESHDDGTPIIKRVIATEGQKVDIDFEAGIVYVDGISLNEPYTFTPTNLYEGVDFPVRVPKGCIFVMGDNRNDSKDSRNPEIGMVDCREVIGKAIFIIFPGNEKGHISRDFERIGVLQ